jgi:hypothetical protein
MKYSLSYEQFTKLWKISMTTNNSYWIRLQNWNDNYQPKFKLDYVESNDPKDSDFHGAIIGTEYHITMFILQL